MTARERMVGSSSCGFSVSRMSEVCSGGSSRTLSRLLAASFMKADEVKMVNARLRLDRRAVVGHVDRLADLAELDEQLRRVGRNDEHVGVGLDEDARLALVGVAHVVAGGDGFGDAASSRLAESAMRVQLEQTPQKSGRPSDSVGLRQLTALASISASVYLPAPRGPARMSEWGKRPARMLSRRCVTVAALPRKSWKPTD